MPIPDIVAALIEERHRLNRAIEALQGPAPRRGKPAKTAPAITAIAPAATNHRRGMSAAARKAQSRWMKAYWATKRRNAGKKA